MVHHLPVSGWGHRVIGGGVIVGERIVVPFLGGRGGDRLLCGL